MVEPSSVSQRSPLPMSPSDRLATAGASLVCLLAGLYLAQARHDAQLLKEANHLGLARQYEEAVTTARMVKRPPSDAQALAVQAYALERLDRPRAASLAYERAVRRDPNNWILHRDWAVLLASLGKRRQAAQEMGLALRLNPRLELPPGFTRPLRAS
jgi:Flp pilus assembly protein TadD